MKNIISIFVLALSILFSPFAIAQNNAKEKNNVDILKIAQDKATKDKKNIMILFSGLQWCGPCKKFDKDVVKNKTFKNYAQKNLVFVEIDLKQNGNVEINIDKKKDSKISRLNMGKLKDFRKELAEKFQVKGVPTAIILNNKGDVLFKHVGSGINAKDFVKKISTKK